MVPYAPGLQSRTRGQATFTSGVNEAQAAVEWFKAKGMKNNLCGDSLPHQMAQSLQQPCTACKRIGNEILEEALPI